MRLVDASVLTVNGLGHFLINLRLLVNLLWRCLRVNRCGFVSWWTVGGSWSIFLDLSVGGHRSRSANWSGCANGSRLSRIAIFTWESYRANGSNRSDGTRAAWITRYTWFALGSNRAKRAYGSNWSRSTRVARRTRFALGSNWSWATWIAGSSDGTGKTILTGLTLQAWCAYDLSKN